MSKYDYVVIGVYMILIVIIGIGIYKYQKLIAKTRDEDPRCDVVDDDRAKVIDEYVKYYDGELFVSERLANTRLERDKPIDVSMYNREGTAEEHNNKLDTNSKQKTLDEMIAKSIRHRPKKKRK